MPIKILASRKVQYVAIIIIKEIKRKASDLLCHYLINHTSCAISSTNNFTLHGETDVCMHDLPDQLDYQYNII